jgi:hypothetical protein
VEADPIQGRLHDRLVAEFEAHVPVRRLSGNRLWILTVHRRVQEEDVVHRVVSRRSRTIRLAVLLG